jgi:hypothetical protein
MPIASDALSLFSNFYLDGEAAFMDGGNLDQNPYVPGDEAAEAWRAGWLAASRASTVLAGGASFAGGAGFARWG